MDLFRINTTAFEDEDFILLTNLSVEQIKKVITPIVLKERQSGDEEDFYDNDDLTNALVEAYPDAVVQLYTDEFETISI
jgi:Golgi nucleoside diphosphatase